MKWHLACNLEASMLLKISHLVSVGGLKLLLPDSIPVHFYPASKLGQWAMSLIFILMVSPMFDCVWANFNAVN
eukprot:2259620-Amphidinium_carterae.3